MSKKSEGATADEIRTKRLVIEDDWGRERVVIQCGIPQAPSEQSTIELSIHATCGDPMLHLFVDADDSPRLSVGHPDRGTSIIALRSEIQFWAGGNMVACVSSSPSPSLQFFDSDGRPSLRIPAEASDTTESNN